MALRLAGWGFTIDYLRFTIGVKNAGKFAVEKGAILGFF